MYFIANDCVYIFKSDEFVSIFSVGRFRNMMPLILMLQITNHFQRLIGNRWHNNWNFRRSVQKQIHLFWSIVFVEKKNNTTFALEHFADKHWCQSLSLSKKVCNYLDYIIYENRRKHNRRILGIHAIVTYPLFRFDWFDLLYKVWKKHFCPRGTHLKIHLLSTFRWVASKNKQGEIFFFSIK